MSSDADFCGLCGERLVAADDESLDVEQDDFPESEGEWTGEDEAAMRSLAKAVADARAQGTSKQEIVEGLVGGGWPEESARGFVDQVDQAVSQHGGVVARPDVTWDFVIGVGALAIGGAITWGTYTSAGPGETYWIMFGPMIYGGYRILRGIVRLVGG